MPKLSISSRANTVYSIYTVYITCKYSVQYHRLGRWYTDRRKSVCYA